MPKGLLQVSSKPKGSSVSVRRRARSGPPRFEEASSTPKRNLEGGGSLEKNRDTSRGKSHSRKSDLSTAYAVQRGFVFISPVVNNNHRGGASCSEGVVVPLETSNQKFKDRPLLRETLSNPKVHGVSVRLRSQCKNLPPSYWKVFRLRAYASEDGQGSVGSGEFEGSRKKRRTVRRFLSTQNPDVVMLQETKREIWDRRSFKCSEKVLGSFSVTVKLNSDEEGFLWLTSVYGLDKAVWRKDFWMELQDLHGLTFPRWCVGGDFNVIRRISEKMGDSKLTVNMRCFDEFIRESGLLDPPLRNAAFTWSNMQVDPICKRFENMWLLHPEFKEKFRDWWQECTVEGWEGHKFMRKLKFIKSKLKEWNIVFGMDLKKEGVRGFVIEGRGRLRKVLHETIFGSQGAFVEGRQILDAILIANEVVDEKRRSGEEGVVFKIDFEKTYDHVDWGFLDHVLQRKGFSQKWRSWMRGCLSSSSFAILVNGNAKGWVKASRGLRQGDPLSPSFYSSSRCSNFKIEKMQRDFLWSGVEEGKKDHLIRWEVVSRPKRWERKERSWHKVIASIYGTHPNGWDANMVVRWSHRCPWKAIAQVFQEFSPFVRLVVAMGREFGFGKIFGGETKLWCSQFADLYRVISVKNLTVSNVLGNSLPLSWNFNFRRNLTDSEIDLFQRLMSSLNSVLLSPSSSDSRAWSLSSSGSFSVKSFF
ncbi:hypothetical protein CK203_083670 [Vitis vinifera]|uniref:Reverse transcriptase domain-containing protein n=1 Tax=Vitis vinifera TaxID=29760 RepID=A0A438CYF6_VITVI|nr:hypothetical protein CK203_083670 [Vitis vinifera]